MTGGITGQGQAQYANTYANINAHGGIPSGGDFTPLSSAQIAALTGGGGATVHSAATSSNASSPNNIYGSGSRGGVNTGYNGGGASNPPSTQAATTPQGSKSSSTAFSTYSAEKAGFSVLGLSTEPGGIYLSRGGNYYNEYGNLIGNSHTGIVTSNPQGISAIQNALSSEPAGYEITFGGSVINAQGIPVGNTLINTPYKGSGISEASLTPPIDYATFGNKAQIQWSATNPYNFILEENIPGYAQKFQFTGTVGGEGISAGTIYATDSAVNQAWSALTGGAPLWGSQGIITSYANQKGLQSLPITFNLQTGEISSSGAILGEIGTYGSPRAPLYGNVETASLNYNYNLGNVISGNGQTQTYVTNTPALTQSQAQSLLTNVALFSSYQPGNYIYSGPGGYNQVQVSGSAGYATLQALSGGGNTITGYTSAPFIPGNYAVSTNSSSTPQYVSLEAFATAPPGTTYSQTTTTQAPANTASSQLSGNLSPFGIGNAIVAGLESPFQSLFGSSNTTAPTNPSVISSYGNSTVPLSSAAISYIAAQEGLPINFNVPTTANVEPITPYPSHTLQSHSYQSYPNPPNNVSASSQPVDLEQFASAQRSTSLPSSASAASSITKSYNLTENVHTLSPYENYFPRQSISLTALSSTSIVSNSPVPIKPSNHVPAFQEITALGSDVWGKESIFAVFEYPFQLVGYAQAQVANPQSPYSVIQGAVNQANAAPIKTPAQWFLKETGISSASEGVLLSLAFWSPAASAAVSAVPVLGGQAPGLISNAQVINSPTASPETKVFAFAGMLGTGLYDAVTAYYVTLGIGGVIDLAAGATVAGTTAGTGATVGAATRAAIGAVSGSSEEYAANLAAYATEQSAANAAYAELSLAAKVGKAAISISNFANSYALAGYGISYGQVATGTYIPTYTTTVGQDIFIKQTIGGLENAAFATAVTLGAAGVSAGWSAFHPEPVSAANGGVLQGGDLKGPKVTIIENYPKPVSAELPGGGIMLQSDPGILITHISENPLQPMIDQGQVVMGVKEGADNAFTAVMRDSEVKMGLYGNQVLMSKPTVDMGETPVYLRNNPAAINFAAKVANLKAAEQASDLLGQSSVSLSGVKAVQLPIHGEYNVEVPLVQVSTTYAETPAVKGNWLSQQLENLRVSVLGSETTYLSTTLGDVNMFASVNGKMPIGLATQGLDSEWNTYVSTTNPLMRFLGLDAITQTASPIASPSVQGMIFETIATKNPDSLSFVGNTRGGVTSLIGHVEGTDVAYENGMVEYTGEGVKLGMTSEGAPINLKIRILASNGQEQGLAQMLDAYYSPKSPFTWTVPSGRSVDLGLDQIGDWGAFSPFSRENPLVTSLGVEPIYGTSAGESAPDTSLIPPEATPSMNSAGRYLGTSGGRGMNDASTAEYNGPAGTSVQISNPMRTMFEPPPSQIQSAAAGAIASQAAQVASQSQLEASLFTNPSIPSLIDPAALASPHAITNINSTRGLSIASFKTSTIPQRASTVTSTTTAPTLSTATLGTLLNQENQQLLALQTIASLGYQQFEQQTLGYTNQFVSALGYAGAYAQYQALTAPLQKEVSSIETTISSLLGTTSTLSLNSSSVSQAYLQGVEYQIAADIQNIFNLEAGLGLTVLAGESPMAAELGSSISGITISGMMNELEPAQKLRKESTAPLSNMQGSRESFLPAAVRNIKELNKLRSNQRANRIEDMRERERSAERGRERLRDEYNYRERFQDEFKERYGEVYAPEFAFKPVTEQSTSQISRTTTSERNPTVTGTVAPPPPPPPNQIPPPVILPESPNNFEPLAAAKGNGILNYTPSSEYHPSATTQLLPELEPEFEKEFVPALSGVLVRPLKEPASLKAKIKNPSA